jgi:site-specific DNA-methyltransferase (adenine-specific)
MNRGWIGIDITYQVIETILTRLEDDFRAKSIAASVTLDGLPKDMASAVALAHKKDDRVRKEFEKWAILTYTENRAVIKKTKGADGGIDGVFYFWNGGEMHAAKMVLQAKSGGVQRKDIAAPRGDMEKEGAALACLSHLSSRQSQCARMRRLREFTRTSSEELSATEFG